jgi:hypothetical protein
MSNLLTKLLLIGRFTNFLFILTIGTALLTIQIEADPQQTPDIKSAQRTSNPTEQSTSSAEQPAEPLAITQLWAEFYAARDSAEAARERRDIIKVIAVLQIASSKALSLNRKDLAAWQLNNMGYYSIEEFKKRTDYTFRQNTIEKMRRGPEKLVYIKETKHIFQENLSLLTEATKFLEEAYEMDKDLNDDDRTQKIYSNLAFIDWVSNFISRK